MTVNGNQPDENGDVKVTISTEVVSPSVDGAGKAADAKAVYDELMAKQAKLVSGENIKTINGIPLLGEGDIKISGGGGSPTTNEFVNLQYIENTGTQYIDTGYVLQEDDVISVDFELTDESLAVNGDKYIIDARDEINAVRVSTYGSNYKWYVRFGTNQGTTTSAQTGVKQGNFTLSKATFTLNGQTISSTLPFRAMPVDATLRLLSGLNYETGEVSAPSYARIRSVEITRNGETIRNFRPVQRVSDGELGLRDTVTGEFYTNAGTGIFGYAGEADGSVEVDSELSSTSTNPVQNKVVKAALDGKQNALSSTQLAAANSGITAGKVQKLDAIPSSVPVADQVLPRYELAPTENLDIYPSATFVLDEPFKVYSLSCFSSAMMGGTLTIEIPNNPSEPTYARDFILVVDYLDEENPMTIEWPNSQNPFQSSSVTCDARTDEEADLSCDFGRNVYYISEYAPNYFVVSRFTPPAMARLPDEELPSEEG